MMVLPLIRLMRPFLSNLPEIDPRRIETLLIPIAFAYILCVLEGEKREETGDVQPH